MTTLPPIERSVSVSWSPEAAFKRFTADFATWWPWRTHSIGGQCVKRLVFEPGVGGRIFEEHADGRRFAWGKVLAWNPPGSFKMSWHPSRPEETAQEVELRFEPEGTGTKVTLVSSHWERWGKGVARARRGYHLGWRYVLEVFGEKQSFAMTVMNGMIFVMRGVQRLRGGQAAVIAQAEGEMPRANAAP
jgi:hypothetical protein